MRAEVNVSHKQITSLWEFTNLIRDRLNGHSEHTNRREIKDRLR